MKGEEKHNVDYQMGNQGHSEENYFQFKAWTEAGIVKDITQYTEFMNNGWRWHGMKVSDHFPEQPIPENLNWDKKQITNHKVGNGLLVGPPPSNGWDQFYKM